MFKNTFLAIVIASTASFIGCERKGPIVIVKESSGEPAMVAEPVAKTKTHETDKLGNAIDAFAANPTAEASADVKKCFARLDGEMADLELFISKNKGNEREEANAKLRNLQAYRSAEALRFSKLPGASGSPLSSDSPIDLRDASEKLKEKARDAGDTIEAGAKKAGNTLKDAAERTKEAVKDAVK